MRIFSVTAWSCRFHQLPNFAAAYSSKCWNRDNGLSLLGSTFISRLHFHCSHNFYVYMLVRGMQLLYMVVVIIIMVMVMVIVMVMVMVPHSDGDGDKSGGCQRQSLLRGWLLQRWLLLW